MPELPEVETITRQLDKALVGQKYKGKRVVRVWRKAKMIIIKFQGEQNLLIHLKMTGQLLLNGQVGKHTRQVIQFDKDKVIFNDLRKFGWIREISDKDLEERLAKLPPDVVDGEFTLNYLRGILASSVRAVKLVILDQQKMGGIGNIYANEALFRAGIDPRQEAKKVSQVKQLHQAIVQVINQGIKLGGTTASDKGFVNLMGKQGEFQNKLMVYENKEKCVRCKTKIEKVKLGGRGTYFCPKCQQ